MLIKEIISALEDFAPVAFQENYDNSGLIAGNPDQETNGALLAIDVTEEVIQEAIHLDIHLVISHHPLIMNGLKKLTGANNSERALILAVKNNIAIYAAHTNMDNVYGGVNSKICDLIGLTNTRILLPVKNRLQKLVTFVPSDHASTVRQALFDAGAGNIGNYNSCSYNLEGKGTFRGKENTHPFAGERGKFHTENEVRIETVFLSHNQKKVIEALLQVHPYEEVAYDIYNLENDYTSAGSGMIGILPEPVSENTFLNNVKDIFKTGIIRHTHLLNKKLSVIAVCGGSGSFLLPEALTNRADAFITADIKYHQFFDAGGRILVMDIGHYESEQFTRNIFYDILVKKFVNFAVRFSEINTNPINYF